MEWCGGRKLWLLEWDSTQFQVWKLRKHFPRLCYFGSSKWIRFDLLHRSEPNCRVVFEVKKFRSSGFSRVARVAGMDSGLSVDSWSAAAEMKALLEV